MSRQTVAVLAALALYFALQTTLRVALGGALEVDEAEMLLLARDWRLGYGPQLPLYNWLQVAAFQVFGLTTAALVVTKNVVLFLAAAGLFLGLRRVLPFGQALAGTLSLAFLPNVVWEFQRASTHSIALLAATTWTMALGLAALDRGRRRDWVALGLVMGLGGLAKINYWLVPVTLLLAAMWPGVPRPRVSRAMLALATAALVVAVPYAWAIRNAGQSLSSVRKMYRADTGLPPGIEGLGEALTGTAAGLVIALLAASLLWRSGRGRAAEGPDWPGPLLVRAGAMALALSFATIALGGVSEVQSRWLVPAFCLIACGLFIAAARSAPSRALSRLVTAAAIVGAVTLAGMYEQRNHGRTTARIDFAPLAALGDRLAPDAVVAAYHVGGNLALLRPGLDIRAGVLPTEPPLSGRILALGVDPPPGKVLEEGVLDLPYTTGAMPPFPVPYRLIDTDPAG